MRRPDAYASAARIIDYITEAAGENEHRNGPGTYDTWSDAHSVIDTYSRGEVFRENLFGAPGLLAEVTEGVSEWLFIMRSKTIYGGDAVWGDMSDEEAARALGITADSDGVEIEAAVEKAIESAEESDLIISKGDHGTAREAVTEAVWLLRDKLRPAEKNSGEIDAGPYHAVREGSDVIEIWDAEIKLFDLPGDTPLEMVPALVRVYEQGREDGKRLGYVSAQYDIRLALGL